MPVQLRYQLDSTQIANIRLMADNMRQRTGYPPNEIDIVKEMTQNPNSQFAQVMAVNMSMGLQEAKIADQLFQLELMQAASKRELRAAYREMHDEDDMQMHDIKMQELPPTTNNQAYNDLLQHQEQLDADIAKLQNELNGLQEEVNSNRDQIEKRLKESSENIENIVANKTSQAMEEMNKVVKVEADSPENAAIRQRVQELIDRAAHGKGGAFLRIKSEMIAKFETDHGKTYDADNPEHVKEVQHNMFIEYHDRMGKNPEFFNNEMLAIEMETRTAPEFNVDNIDSTVKDDNVRDQIEKQKVRLGGSDLLSQIRQGFALKPVADVMQSARKDIYEEQKELKDDVDEVREKVKDLENKQDNIEKRMNQLEEQRDRLQNNIQDKREDYANLKRDKLEAQENKEQDREEEAQKDSNIRPGPGGGR